MFGDACVIVSLMSLEETAEAYAEQLQRAAGPWTSALTAFEAILVLSRHDKLNISFSATETIVSDFLSRVEIDLREPGSARQVLADAISVRSVTGWANASSARSIASTTRMLWRQQVRS